MKANRVLMILNVVPVWAGKFTNTTRGDGDYYGRFLRRSQHVVGWQQTESYVWFQLNFHW